MGIPSLRTIALAILVAVAVTVGQALVNFDATQITDWKNWAVGLGSGIVRAAASAIVTSLVLKNDRAVLERAEVGVVPAAEAPPGTPTETIPVVRADDLRGD